MVVVQTCGLKMSALSMGEQVIEFKGLWIQGARNPIQSFQLSQARLRNHSGVIEEPNGHFLEVA